MKILQAKWKPVREGRTEILHGDTSYNGALQILVDEIPMPKCRWIGRFIYGEEDGFCEVYEYIPGSTEAFGGATITIDFEDGQKENFKGSLWDPFRIPDTIPEHRCISITIDPKVMKQGRTFLSGKITKGLFDQIIDGLKETPEVKIWENAWSLPGRSSYQTSKPANPKGQELF